MTQMIEVAADTYDELEYIVRRDYGDSATIHSKQFKRKRGLVSFLTRKMEVVGSVLVQIAPQKSYSANSLGIDHEFEKKKLSVLNLAKSHKQLKNSDLEESDNGSMADPLISLVTTNETSQEKKAPPQPKSETVASLDPAIGNKIDEMMHMMHQINQGKKTELPIFGFVRDLLEHNDFSKKYIAGIIEQLQKKLTMNQLRNEDYVIKKVYEWIEKSISIVAPCPNKKKTDKCRIRILVGPTGVGKTTTLGKLAGKIVTSAPEGSTMNLALFTIDVFRIGAIEQVAKYAEIMLVPMESIFERSKMEHNIIKYQNYKNIVIDTIGRSPHEVEIYEDMYNVLSPCLDNASVSLVFSASTRGRDILNILDKFEKFNYESIILTKVDETRSIGNVISALSERGKSLSFITNGQEVPNDIMEASSGYLMSKLVGFESIFSNHKGGK